MAQTLPPRADPTAAPSTAPDLLRRLRTVYVARRSGEVHISHGGRHRGLVLREGRIVRGRSDVAGEHLGDVLVRRGLIGQAELDPAVAVALSERRPLGAVLAALGLLDRPRLEEAVGWHVREILFASLEEPGGASAFEEVETSPSVFPDGELSPSVSTGTILLEAARRVQDPATVRDALGDLDRTLVLAADPRLREHPVALTPTDAFVLSRVDGALSARELVDLIPLPSEDAERSLLALLCAGAIVQAPAPRGRWPVPAPGAAPAAGGAADGPPPPEPRPPAGPEAVRRMVLAAYEGLAVRDHFELLGVSPQASPVELRSAYACLARTLRPDAGRDPALGDIGPQREAVFMRVCLAYEVLRDPESRAEYESELRRRKPRPAPTRPTVGVPVPDPGLEERLEEALAAGEALLREGRYYEAIRRIEPSLHQTRDALGVRARLVLARACLENPKWLRRAEAYLHEVLREDPAQVEAYLLLGEIYGRGGLSSRAAAAYRRALELRPYNRQARRGLLRLEGPGPSPDRGASLLRFLKRR